MPIETPDDRLRSKLNAQARTRTTSNDTLSPSKTTMPPATSFDGSAMSNSSQQDRREARPRERLRAKLVDDMVRQEDGGASKAASKSSSQDQEKNKATPGEAVETFDAEDRDLVRQEEGGASKVASKSSSQDQEKNKATPGEAVETFDAEDRDLVRQEKGGACKAASKSSSQDQEKNKATPGEAVETFDAEDRNALLSSDNTTVSSSIRPGAFRVGSEVQDTQPVVGADSTGPTVNVNVAHADVDLHIVSARLVPEDEEVGAPIVLAEASKAGAFWVDHNDRRVRFCLFFSIIALGLGIGLGITFRPKPVSDMPTFQPTTQSPTPQPTVLPEHCDDRGRCWVKIAQGKGLAVDDNFGNVVSTAGDGTRIAVSADEYENNGNEDAGAVVVYNIEKDGNLRVNAEFYGKSGDGINGLLSRDGSSIIISGQFSAGEHGDQRDIGEISVFKENVTSSSWDVIGNPFYGESTGARAGRGFDISKDGKIIAYSSIKSVSDGDVNGYVRIWQEVNSEWLPLGNPNTILGDEARQDFGWHLSLSDDGRTLLVGSRSTRDNLGSVHIFQCRDCDHANGDTNGGWANVGRTDEIDQNEGKVGVIHGDEFDTKFGVNTAISADGKTIVGGKIKGGKARIFMYSAETSSWKETGEVEGKAVALSADGRRLAVGVHLKSDPGWAKVYDYSENGGWEQVGGDLRSGKEGDNFGGYVALSANGDRLVVGNPSQQSEQKMRGSVSIYELQ